MLIFAKLYSTKKKFFVQSRVLGTLLISIFLLGLLTTLFIDDIASEYLGSKNPLSAFTGDIIFQGKENALNVTDYGNLYADNQEITISDQEDVNLTYYLDDIHDWKVSQIDTNISNLNDKRNWINNSGFQLPNIYRSYLETPLETPHPYSQNHNPDPYSPEDIIVESSALYIRAHFVNFSFQFNHDYLYIYDILNEVYYVNDGEEVDFYSPWVPGNTLKFNYDSDNSEIGNWYGYYIDYFEFVNESSNLEINSDWGFNFDPNWDYGKNYYGVGEIENTTAVYVATYAEYYSYYEFSYEDNAFSEIYQNFTIPRKAITDAYVSFDYFCEFGLETNDNYIYVAINNQKIYSKGMGEIYDLGKREWHKSGKIIMDLWDNTSNIFSPDVENQNFNLSIGFKVDIGWSYSNSEDGLLNFIWFDNVSLVLTSIANSTQSDIMLNINSEYLIDSTTWGESSLSLNSLWESDPISLTISTLSPYLSFNLDTTLYGYRNTKTKINQQNDDGLTYKILENGTIIWNFLHNLYMPSQYSDFDVFVDKPYEWYINSVLDPTFFEVNFEGGKSGDNFININKTYALYPGWWSFEASSPNYLNLANTKLFKDGIWTNSEFLTGEKTLIKTQINYSNQIPLNLGSTQVNLTIYDPEGSVWFTELKTPLINGSVLFSELEFDALNTTGGLYEYTIFWTNGTALGGLKSSFTLNHLSSLRLLKPDDAKGTLLTNGFVGDIIPVRVFLYDLENNNSISDSIISYNWTSGQTFNFTESALGVYETILDTADLASRGLYEINISSSKIGFLNTDIILKIDLGEETKLQRLESDYNIELHANSTIKFKFMDFDDDGIDGAIVNVSIADPLHYNIMNTGGGIYDIEFSTIYISNIGIYQLNFSFDATGYEPQYYTYQFQMIEQSVMLKVYKNQVELAENNLIELTYYEKINLSIQATANIDLNYITGGNVTLITGSFQYHLNETIGYWYNCSIDVLPDFFSFGINYVYLRFEHPNYRPHTFGFQLLVNQVEFEIDILGHENSITVDIGGHLEFEVELLDHQTFNPIENATILYVWDYGVGELFEMGTGIYKLSLDLPENLQGNFDFKLIISKEGDIYKITEFSLLLAIGEPSFPTWILWLILIGSAAVITTLGILSLRSYVIIPMRRKKEARLITRTQRFRDLQNIQAIVIMHRYSGIPLFAKSYTILEKQKKELFSGFIQAITTIGEEIIGKKSGSEDSVDVDDKDKTRTILELDFKYFYCLICDRQDLRLVLVLRERASERLKKQVSDLTLGLMLQLGQQIEKWDGSIDQFDTLMPPIISKYIELSFKDAFTLNSPAYIADTKKEGEFSSMEKRVLNVIYSMAKSKSNFNLDHIVDIVHEENKSLVIDAIEGLVSKKIIIPTKE